MDFKEALLKPIIKTFLWSQLSRDKRLGLPSFIMVAMLNMFSKMHSFFV